MEADCGKLGLIYLVVIGQNWLNSIRDLNDRLPGFDICEVKR